MIRYILEIALWMTALFLLGCPAGALGFAVTAEWRNRRAKDRPE